MPSVREFTAALDERYPFTANGVSEPVIIADPAAWDAGFAQCGADEERYLREGREDQQAHRDRVLGPVGAWLACRDLYVTGAGAEDSAGLADGESASPADAIAVEAVA